MSNLVAKNTKVTELVPEIMGLNVRTASIEACLDGYRQAEMDEDRAIKLIKDASAYNKGGYLYVLKEICKRDDVKDKFEDVVRKELTIGTSVADRLISMYEDKTYLSKLKETLSPLASGDKKSLRLEMLDLPDVYNQYNKVSGLKDKLAFEAKIARENKDLSKEERKVVVKIANAVAKAENYYKGTLEQLEEFDLKVVDGKIVERKAPNKKVTPPAKKATQKTIDRLQEAVDAFASDMFKENLRLSNNVNRAKFFAEQGWTEEDGILHRRFMGGLYSNDILKNMTEGLISIAPDWKKKYKQLSRITHPDHGGDAELQSIVNAINSIMKLANEKQKAIEIAGKWRNINNLFTAYVHGQSESASFALSDAVREASIELAKENK